MTDDHKTSKTGNKKINPTGGKPVLVSKGCLPAGYLGCYASIVKNKGHACGRSVKGNLVIWQIGHQLEIRLSQLGSGNKFHTLFKNDKGLILTHFSETGKIAEMIKIANKEEL